VEKGKKQFAGFELTGRTLGVIGLGAIGRALANTALELGMKVVGFDPGITVHGAWQLSSDVESAASVDDLLSRVDFVSFHVPLLDSTKDMINADRIKLMKKGATILNFARGGIVSEDAVLAGLDSGKLNAYVCDFPSNKIKNHSKVISLPHLGASTEEAEDNCAVMVADQLKDYLENGNIKNSVNFPDVKMPRADSCARLTVVNMNVPNMVGQITTHLANANLNIVDLINKSKGEVAYTMIDVDGDVPKSVTESIASIQGVLAVRSI